MLSQETIVAPVTPPGEGGVGIVRLSGPEAIELLSKTFQGRTSVGAMESHRLYHGHLTNNKKQVIDEVLVVVMRSPRSYTGEDVVEVHCHGGSQIMRSVLDVFLCSGALMASPGEFTQRAFLNGRLDLAQAEAVIDVIRARSVRASQVALGQLEGKLSCEIYRFTEQLKKSLALIEAHIDFPDDEVGSLDFSTLLKPTQEIVHDMRLLVETFEVGRVLREGVTVLILGRPNVGKSSLMNALLGESRAIVTEIAGTTRDTLEESLVLGGFPIQLVDAAGVRETVDPVEHEGVRRVREKALSADIVLMVVDGSASLCEEDFQAYELCDPGKTIVVINKSDKEKTINIEHLSCCCPCVSVSAKRGLGLDLLRSELVRFLGVNELSGDGEGVVVTEGRHRQALLHAIDALESFFVSVRASAPLECLALEVRDALGALGQITGETTPDEILNDIFANFCIGK